MCLIALAWQASKRFPLVIAANRDEFLDRPTAPLSKWTTQSGHTVIGGRDLREGGSWMAFTLGGRFAMLTNVRNPRAPVPAAPTSRGHLVVSWLTSSLDVGQWAEGIHGSHFQGFNLIAGDWAKPSCFYLSNQNPVVPVLPAGRRELMIKELMPGQIYGLSNAALDTPWPKTQQLKSAVTAMLEQEDATQRLQEKCLEALLWDQPAEDLKLPDTGIPQDLESALSSIFVRYPRQGTPRYGTRSSMVACLNPNNMLHLLEATHSATTPRINHRPETLDWHVTGTAP